MKPSLRIAFCGSLSLVTVLGAGCDQGNEFKPPPTPKVTVQRPVVKEVTTYKEFTGRTEAIDTVEVRARVKGFLQSVDFEPGQMVNGPDRDDPDSVGDLLFSIEPEQFEAAQAAAQAEVARMNAAKELAEVTRDRAQAAYEQDAVSDIEMAEKAAEVDAATAAVQAAEAALVVAQIDLSYTKIYAPIAGRISREQVDVGNLVGAGESTLLTTIVQDHPIYAYVEVSERDLLEYTAEGRPRDRAERERKRLLLRLADGSAFDHEGVVDFAETRVDPTTGTLQLRATFPNPDGRLFPGLFVRVLAPDVTGQQMLIPEVAILRDLAGAYVLLADEKNIVQRRDIQLGARVGTERIITSGLDASDRLIVNGIQRAIPGNPVDPQEQSADSTSGDGAPASSEPDADSDGGDDSNDE